MRIFSKRAKRNLAGILACLMTFSTIQGVYADELGSPEVTSDTVSAEGVIDDSDSSTDIDSIEGEDSGNDESQADSDNSTDTDTDSDSVGEEGSDDNESSADEDNPTDTDADTPDEEGGSGNDGSITDPDSSTESTTEMGGVLTIVKMSHLRVQVVR